MVLAAVVPAACHSQALALCDNGVLDPAAVGPLAEYYSNCCALYTIVITRILVGDFFVQSSDVFEAHCGRAGCTNSVMRCCMVLAGCSAGLYAVR